MGKVRFWRWLLLAAFLPVAGVSLVLAQQRQDFRSAGRASEGWSVRDLYPNLNQVKIEMSGTEATPLNSGLVLISNLVIKNYAVSGGAPKSVIEAPECFYDPQLNWAFSPGPLKARADEGKLLLDGVGFRYETTNSLLTISNRVHTIVYQSGASPTNATATNTPPTHVFSDGLIYAMKSGQAIYRNHVRIEDPKMKLRAGILTVQLPPEGSKVSHLGDSVAEENVIIDFISEKGDTNHAIGDKAVYKYQVTGNLTNEIMELSGHPRLDITNGWMTADIFSFDRLQDKIRGIGSYHFHSSANTQFGPAGPAKGQPAETEVWSDFWEFETRTGLANYEGHVRVRNPSLELDAGKLLARLPPGGTKTNFSQRIVAMTNVMVNYIDKDGRTHATGEQAVYTFLQLPNNLRTNEVMELTGNPVLERTNGWMTADIVTMDISAGKLRGRGHHHSIIKSAPVRTAKTSSPSTTTNALGTSDTEIFSDNAEFTTQTSEAFYEGRVRVFNPQLTLTSETLTAKLPPRGATNSQIEHILAETAVRLYFVDEKGVTNNARADKAIYDYKVVGNTTNQVLQLIGHPNVVQGGMSTSYERTMVYDLVTGIMTGYGQPTVIYQLGTSAPTNTNAAPNPVGR